MRTVLSTVLALAAWLAIAGSLSAAEEKKCREGKHPQHPTMERMDMLKGLSLTEDQKAEVKTLKKEYGAKFKEGWKQAEALHKEFREKVTALLTPEQKEQLQKKCGPTRGHPATGQQKHEAARDRGRLGWGDEFLKGLNLTEEQKAKVDELKKEYAPKFKAAWEKTECVLTEAQKKAREEARKAARAAGKKGAEVWREVEAAVKLTDQQKAKMAEARTAAGALHKEVHEKITALLTPEQKDQVNKQREERRAHRSDGK